MEENLRFGRSRQISAKIRRETFHPRHDRPPWGTSEGAFGEQSASVLAWSDDGLVTNPHCAGLPPLARAVRTREFLPLIGWCFPGDWETDCVNYQ